MTYDNKIIINLMHKPMYYYVLDLADVKSPDPMKKDFPPEVVSDKVKKYVTEKKFACMNDKYIQRLATKEHMSFKQTLKDVFAYFLKIERYVTRSVCGMEYRDEESNSFISWYIDLVNGCEDPKKKDKCESLRILYKEDIDFLYVKHDSFLMYTRDSTNETERDILQQNERDKKYKQAVILLDNNKEYLGHIYIWSWLNMNNTYYNDPFVLEFGGIRTSFRNLLCGGTGGVAPIFVNIIADWAERHGWKYLHVALDPIGPMPGYLIKCGFNSDQFIKISDLKCRNTENLSKNLYEDLNKGTDIFSDVSLKTLLSRQNNDPVIKKIWFSTRIAKHLYELLVMSYPDRKPTYEELEYVYISSFDKNDEGYKIKSRKENVTKYHDPVNITDYNFIGTWINSLPEGKKKDNLLTRFHEWDENSNYSDEAESKIDELESILISLNEHMDTLKTIPKPGDESYTTFVDNIHSADEEIYISTLKGIFAAKVRSQQFMFWYSNLISAIDMGMRLEYNESGIIDALENLRTTFQGYENWKCPKARMSIHVIYIKIMERIIFLPL
jgi:hypothetical protein